jgi:hypothetical protein
METYPFECNLASRLHWHKRAIALCALVAHDIYASKPIRTHKAIVQVVCLPSHGRGDGSLVFQRGVPALVCYAVGDDFVDMAMGADERRKSDGEREGLHDCGRGI